MLVSKLEDPFILYYGKSPIPFSSTSPLVDIRLNNKSSGFCFYLGQETIEPNLNNVVVLKKLRGISFSHFNLIGHKLSVFEHFIATMYANGIDNYGTRIIGSCFPQPQRRELLLHNLISEQNVDKSKYSFSDSFMLPETVFKETKKENGYIKTSPNLDNKLNIIARCNYGGIQAEYSFSPEIDDYRDIAASKAHAQFWGYFSSEYHGRLNQDTVMDIARHTVVDILGAITLLANQKKARVHGNIECYLAGHEDHLNALKRLA